MMFSAKYFNFNVKESLNMVSDNIFNEAGGERRNERYRPSWHLRKRKIVIERECRERK